MERRKKNVLIKYCRFLSSERSNIVVQRPLKMSMKHAKRLT